MEVLYGAALAARSFQLYDALSDVLPVTIMRLIDKYARDGRPREYAKRMLASNFPRVFSPRTGYAVFAFPGMNGLLARRPRGGTWLCAANGQSLQLRKIKTNPTFLIPITTESIWDFLCGLHRDLFDNLLEKTKEIGEVVAIRTAFRAAVADYHARRCCAARARLLRGDPNEDNMADITRGDPAEGA